MRVFSAPYTENRPGGITQAVLQSGVFESIFAGLGLGFGLGLACAWLTCYKFANKSTTSRDGIWETTRHNRHNGLLPATTCYRLVTVKLV